LTRVSSIFSQILQLIPRFEFESAVRKHDAERHARGFSSWGQNAYSYVHKCIPGRPRSGPLQAAMFFQAESTGLKNAHVGQLGMAATCPVMRLSGH
jgi:hypothetical protein